MNENTGIIFILGALFAWKFYQHRKAIWHNMNLYGSYMANVMKEKVDKKKNEIKKKNERK